MAPNLSPPTDSEIRSISAELGLDLSTDDVEAFADLAPVLFESYERVIDLEPGNDAELERTRRMVLERHPDGDADPHNAWLARCRIDGATDGRLAGYEIGLKDNVSLAGVPMTCGWAGLEGYVPESDATVVRRLLAAGATITGKLNMDSMAFASSGETSDFGPIGNPNAPDHLAGGSSGGSAAAVAAGDVDVAVATDQAGSIRIPAAFCGTVGLKPTHGLVPYTGIVGQGYTFDHVGPIASSVRDCARTLSAIAGPDVVDGEPVDPRQSVETPVGDRSTTDFERALDDREGRLTIGVLEEGFGWPRGEPAVDDTVLEALEIADDDQAIETLERSVPIHSDGMHVWAAVIAESNMALLQHNGVGYFVDGAYDESFAQAFSAAIENEAASLSKSLQLTLVVARYVADRHDGLLHASGQNLRRRLRRAYDEALEDVDVLALPTTPITTFERRDGLSTGEIVQRAYSAVENTSPFNMTGHPAISIPCGTAGGLPVGLMLVATRHDESTLLWAADRLEGRLSASSPSDGRS
ncbi:amidase family protein [Natrarchaeobius oligotrophus]|uniref:Amidase n=1 Tax=Natrarchaeobius chitinivorans TaxID=1679083 RepID=A0A3N6PGM4_NATCH|nr:amidase family protein [Natrarchaeobius chitinivorans]RQG99469.1 amidase [Natrarchaeobius chitinivorans]